jgi:hypothetical protein
MTLESLMSKRVIAGDGRRLGRLFAFKGEWGQDAVTVTHFCVGLAAWAETMVPHAHLRSLLRRRPPLELPWESIASAGRAVRLKPEWDRARCLSQAKAAEAPGNE